MSCCSLTALAPRPTSCISSTYVQLSIRTWSRLYLTLIRSCTRTSLFSRPTR
jgi:hypothetical protein